MIVWNVHVFGIIVTGKKYFYNLVPLFHKEMDIII